MPSPTRIGRDAARPRTPASQPGRAGALGRLSPARASRGRAGPGRAATRRLMAEAGPDATRQAGRIRVEHAEPDAAAVDKPRTDPRFRRESPLLRNDSPRFERLHVWSVWRRPKARRSSGGPTPQRRARRCAVSGCRRNAGHGCRHGPRRGAGGAVATRSTERGPSHYAPKRGSDGPGSEASSSSCRASTIAKVVAAAAASAHPRSGAAPVGVACLAGPESLLLDRPYDPAASGQRILFVLVET